MTEERCCGKNVEIGQERAVEIVAIEKTANYCPMCEDYARREASKPFVVMSCEGGCLRGEVARQAANMVCYDLLPESTARLCLGGAFTKDTGQRNLARSATKLIALEGCFIECGSRMMKGVIPGLSLETVVADQLYEFDRSLFGINEMAEEEIKVNARKVAEQVVQWLQEN